ncbi:MAG TPA: hypothetical protein VLH79_10160 [Chthonomonadales bacterium]|nr:hypothetical protein [Chthonomonadales bacterium]
MAPGASAPCPHCKAENLAHRRACWRCARTLPTSLALGVGLTGRLSASDQGVARAPDRLEVEDVLPNTVVVGEGAESPETIDPAEHVEPTRLLWMIRRRSPHT